MTFKLCTAVLLASTVASVPAQPSGPAPTGSANAAGPNAAAAAEAPVRLASVPPGESVVGYRSAFDGYRPFTEPPVVSWRGANDRVGRIGGSHAHAREGGGENRPDGDVKPSMPAGHGGTHSGHKTP